jgi:hypothetical protein
MAAKRHRARPEGSATTDAEPQKAASPSSEPSAPKSAESGDSADPKAEKTEGKDGGAVPVAERRGQLYAMDLEKYIDQTSGQYLKDQDGNLYVLIGGQRIPLNFDRNNHALANLMINVCLVSTLLPGAQSAIQRLQCIAESKAGKIHSLRFSALIGERVYIPVANGRSLVCIAADCVSWEKNGINKDFVWVDHPEDDPFRWMKLTEITGQGELARFERLCVDTQACVKPAMRWLVAMQEGLFPFVRDACPSRFITAHIGPSQEAGKTTGAQRFTLLHGLGEVKGSCTAAALANMGDIGLLVADNKEQANWNTDLIDYFLFLSTGARRERSTSDGKMRVPLRGRPIGVITTIEGVSKDELQNRTVEVEYLVTGPKIDRAKIENEIRTCRHGMLTALAHVLQRWLTIRMECGPTPDALPNFRENFQTIADLLRAYGEVAKKPEGWAEGIIAEWAVVLAGKEPDREDEFEHPICRVIRERDAHQAEISVSSVEYSGRKGKLYVMDWGSLLASLQRLNLRDLPLPKTTNGLSRRVRSGRYRSFEFLDEEKAPDVPELKHTESRKVLGLFFPEDQSADPADPC